MIGTTLGDRYRITRLVGQGGMGAVYEADDVAAGRVVAVKLINSELSRNASLVVRFEQERKAVASIASPHIAVLLDAGTHDDRPYMVMEFLRGEDLGELLGRLGPIPPGVALRLVAQAAAGLREAHQAGIVHRDIKPANLYVAHAEGGRRVVKVLDFGVAKVKLDWAQSSESGGLTRTGAVLGSPLYMAPEQARGSRSVDERADLWSLGVVLYRALAGRVPNHGIDGLGELIIAICTQAPPSIREAAPWVSPEVAAIVSRALTLDPRHRFQTAGELLDAIHQVVTGTDIVDDMLRPLSDQERAWNPDGLRSARPSSRADLAPATPVSMVPSSRGRGRRVLIVEDNEMNMDMLSRRLERKGYQVLKAGDGETGVALCCAERPDLVLMDISLPGMDGIAATRELRAAEATRAIPIIALTAHALAADRERALAAGCDDYETKPVEFMRLLGKIEAQLQRGANP